MALTTIDLKVINLETITARHFHGTEAVTGAAIIESSLSENKSAQLQKLLRSHLIAPPSRKAVTQRAAIDDLLAYYCLLEVASIADVVPQQLPDTIAEQAIRCLTEPSVRRYYEKLYPVLLPQLFLKRLQSGPVIQPVNDDVAISSFLSMLQLSEVYFDDDVDIFLGFLEDGVYEDEDGEYDLSDVLKTLLSSRQLIERLSIPEDEQSVVDMGLHGLLKYLGFCRALDHLLQSISMYPILQSAFWHYHGYWFQLLGGQVGGVIATAIEEYRKWVPKTNAARSEKEQQAIRLTHESMDQTHLELQRLTSALYRVSLEYQFYTSSDLPTVDSLYPPMPDKVALSDLLKPAIQSRASALSDAMFGKSAHINPLVIIEELMGHINLGEPLKYSAVKFEFVNGDSLYTGTGTVIKRTNEMVLDIAYDGVTTYLIVGHFKGLLYVGNNSAGGTAPRTEARWTKLGDKYVGTWFEEGEEFFFSFTLPSLTI